MYIPVLLYKSSRGGRTAAARRVTSATCECMLYIDKSPVDLCVSHCTFIDR